MARNPSRKIQALACRELARWLASTVRWSEDLKQNPAERSNAERIWGKDHIAWIIANTDRAKKDAEALALVLQESYGDIFPDLSIGKRAPEIGSHDIDGKSVKLSAFKGRVVVLDFWATWCGPCRAMIPHQREMVERLKDKPFALVSISIDEEKETLTKFLAKEKMPWIHWWPGNNEGGVVEDWNIYRVPTIYVIDAQGVIRHKDIRGEELEAGVHKLLEELEQKSSN
ncbi:MAG TPA: TlpA disulfide reductase family protein [Gemmataceae bacterium]|jgi:thiol-disulfide isomerase/thioredoxin|nr:TlpA disulfide reductase family protein [Gemmataceae bacterium]